MIRRASAAGSRPQSAAAPSPLAISPSLRGSIAADIVAHDVGQRGGGDDMRELRIGEESRQRNQLLAGKAQGEVRYETIGCSREQQSDPVGKDLRPFRAGTNSAQ